MIVNDLMKVPGFELVQTLPYGAARFEDEVGRRLTVINANRAGLEGTLGADLIYYNETYKAFVIVQYKPMEQIEHGSIFRFPNAQLTREIGRMTTILENLKDRPPNGMRSGFRMMDNPFFIKLCPRVIFDPDDISLIRGMYLPLDYWQLIETDPTLVGPRGGRMVTFENVGRYFDNTEFIPLMTKGWVGTTPIQSDVLRPLIQEMIQMNRPLTIAVKTEELTRAAVRGHRRRARNA
jgi:hypothetical protein